MGMMELKKVRIVLEGTGYINEEGGIALLATKPTKTISAEIISENNKEKTEK